MLDVSFIDARFFEMLFLICFGLAWPSSILKSVRSKTAKGKSLFFLVIAFCGYLCGITSKLVDDSLSYVLTFYLVNTCMVGTDIVLYIVNSRRDRLADRRAQEQAALAGGFDDGSAADAQAGGGACTGRNAARF